MTRQTRQEQQRLIARVRRGLIASSVVGSLGIAGYLGASTQTASATSTSTDTTSTTSTSTSSTPQLTSGSDTSHARTSGS